MTSASKTTWWPLKSRIFFNKIEDCKPCSIIGKKLKTLISKSDGKLAKKLNEPTENFQNEFVVPTHKKNCKEVYILLMINGRNDIGNMRS